MLKLSFDLNHKTVLFVIVKSKFFSYYFKNYKAIKSNNRRLNFFVERTHLLQ